MSATSQQVLARSVSVLAVALIVATGVLFVGHQTRSDAAGAPAAGAPATATDQVSIQDFLYDPEAVTVAVGAKITFTNEDGAPHTATSGTSPNPDGAFDTGTLTKGQSRSVKLAKAGTFSYYCAIHPFMKGTVTVK
jgi:plastocyanin